MRYKSVRQTAREQADRERIRSACVEGFASLLATVPWIVFVMVVAVFVQHLKG